MEIKFQSLIGRFVIIRKYSYSLVTVFQSLIGRFVINVGFKGFVQFGVSIPYRKVRNFRREGERRLILVSIPYRKVRNS